MSLINCPECNREISNTSKKCIHCGYVLRKKKNKKVIVVLIVSLMILTVVGLLVKRFCLPSSPYHTLFEIMECRSPEKVKNILGEDFENSDLGDGYVYNTYRNIQIDGLDCSYFAINYENDKCTGIDCDIDNMDEVAKDSFFEALVDQFGDIHSYTEEKDFGIELERYFWKNDNIFSVEFIDSTEDKEGTYFIKIYVVWS